ncbi:ArfGap-domain-containing protein [Lentinus tigrinus ALCF2SS1-7]|uniref:ArfGap-domain-containing protein n=1 Tax=Lentinus tigrinus ALCF2SS1-6 TaxID=1328759 RepID=A0A5C2RRN2_9APHY|nr:ArfGap-domain-containing protein [Lentinus tigrinus ALCF2SS1-6]RPD69199.1 ArfGap-domain-containing protein [Lentinus tigrinus ALCF2SS1-7]
MSINKITAERNQRMLLELASQPGNDICADCKTRNPRWASYNLGIFICVNCASIHRKMGTHISKVKSLTLDTWTKEQVEFMKSTGNIKSNAHYNPDEIRHPPPTNMIDAERDSDLEKYIRSKYQYKSYVSRSAQVAALLGPSRSAADRLSSAPTRSQTMPHSAIASTPSSSKIATIPSVPAPTTPASTLRAAESLYSQSQFRSVSQPLSTPSSGQVQQQRPATQPPQPQSSNPIFNDLAQLQAPAANSSLPLQYASPATPQPMGMPTLNTTGLAPPNQFSGLSVSPNNPFPSALAQQQSVGAFGGASRSMSLNTGLSSMNMGGLTPTMTGASPSMFQPQPTQGGLSTPTSYMPQHTTPSPNPFGRQSLTPSNLGVQQSFAPSSFSQQSMLSVQPQGSPMIPTQPMPQGSPMIQTQPMPQSSPMMSMQPMPQGSPMFPTQQLGMMQGSPIFPSQTPGQPQMQMGNPFMQNQPQQGQYGTSAQQFLQQMQPHAPQQQQQQQQGGYGQPSAFGGTGWQQTGFQGQQQWGM